MICAFFVTFPPLLEKFFSGPGLKLLFPYYKSSYDSPGKDPREKLGWMIWESGFGRVGQAPPNRATSLG